ncbi:MAG: hypothetical protein AB8B91_25265 [Rubripirellula sp.]
MKRKQPSQPRNAQGLLAFSIATFLACEARAVDFETDIAPNPIDLRDHKPMLEKHHGEVSHFGENVEAFQNGLSSWISYTLDSINEDLPTFYDIHTTILRFLGIDHTRLTVQHDDIDRRRTEVHGHVIKDIMA